MSRWNRKPHPYKAPETRQIQRIPLGSLLTTRSPQCPYIVMWNLFVGLLLPLLLVFGLYHLMTWFNVLGINDLVFWKRVARTSALAHILLATGFFVFTYFDFLSNRELAGFDLPYGTFLFDRSEFWQLMKIFDTVPMVILAALFWSLDKIGLSVPGLLLLTFVITYAAGTLEWYFLGGGVGALLQRFWTGLKTDDDEDQDWL